MLRRIAHRLTLGLAILLQGAGALRADPHSAPSADSPEDRRAPPMFTWEASVSAANATVHRTGSVIQRLPPVAEVPSPNQPLPVPDSTPEEVFPALPPDPHADGLEPLPPLEDELWIHGGAHLYEPKGDQAYHSHGEDGHHAKKLRLPENWQAPQPLTLFQDFLGADPIRSWPGLSWPGATGYAWEPRVVAYGAYSLFGFALENGPDHQSGIGHQLLFDVDWRLTGTERFHLQWRPIGRKNTGGSYYQFSAPEGYIDNSTGVPDRWWFEGELHSMFQGWTGNQFIPRDYHVVLGKFPLLLQNALLLNDDVTGVAVNKNTILVGDLSNLNVQLFYAFDDVDTDNLSADLVGTNISADYKLVFFEATYAFVDQRRDPSRDAHYAALSATKFLGRYSVAGRALFKWGDPGGIGAGELLVIESNWTREFTGQLAHSLGIEHAVYYANLFRATKGWNPISGGNFDRLRSSFELNPLVSIAQGTLTDTYGAALGVQLFRHHDDESITPEIAFEAPGGTPVWGVGLRYQRKTSVRSFFEVRGVSNWSNDPAFKRNGVFASEVILF